MTELRHADFDSVVEIMQELGTQIVVWGDDESAKTLHSKREFKTDADRRAHNFLNEKLAALFPGTPIVSEEDVTHSDMRPERYWLIDPIDGTASWYEGFDGFVTQAAYIEKAEPLFGVIHSPITGCTWTAVRGDGGRLNGKRLPRLRPSQRLVVIDNTPEPRGITAELMKQISATGYRESGSLGLKSALVADGSVDLFVKRVAVRDWDIASAAVLLREVGGCLALPSGMPFIFDGQFTKTSGVVVARDPALLGLALNAIADIEST